MSDLPDDNPDVVAAAAAPASADTHEEPVLVYQPTTEEEADVVRATLEAAGIPAIQQLPNVHAGFGIVTETVGGDTWSDGIYVAPSNVEAARAILNAPPLTEAELIAAAEADPTTLEQAEENARNA